MKNITKMSVSLTDKFFSGWWMVREIPAQCDCHEAPKPQISDISVSLLKMRSSKVFPQTTTAGTRQISGSPCCKDSEIMKWGDFAEKHRSQQLIASEACLDSPSVLPSLPFRSRSLLGDIKSKARWNYCCVSNLPWAQGWGTVRTDSRSALWC